MVSYCAYNFGYFLRVIRFWLCLQICAQLSSQLFLWQCLSSKLSSLVNSYWTYTQCSLAKLWYTSRSSIWRSAYLQIHVWFANWRMLSCSATIVDPTLDTWWISWSYYIIVTSQGWQQVGGSSMCSGSAGRAADPPTTAPAKTPTLPREPEGVPGRWQENQKSKHHCAWTSVSCDWTVAAANIQHPGGPAGRVQQETNQSTTVCTSMYAHVPCPKRYVLVCTCLYSSVYQCIEIYRFVLSCTTIYHDIPVLVHTSTYEYVFW